MSALAIMLTRRCNMACAHCSVESGPKAGEKGPSLEELLASVRAAAEAGVRAVIVTGGEPMLRERAAIEVVRECRRLGLGTRIATNGFWGRTPERARRTLVELVDAGLNGLTVSYDRFHAAFQGPEPVVNIARAAADLCFPVDVNVTRLAEDGEIEALVAPFAALPSVRLRFYDVQPVGAAREMEGAAFRSEVEGFCSACGIPALTDDGRVTACNGPSYFRLPGDPLAIGSLADASLGELLARHREDPILDTIRTAGPAGLRDVMVRIPRLAEFPFRERYAGMCDLCHHITSSPDAVAALRDALSAPERTAERVARQRLIDREREGGTLSRARANADGAARIFLALGRGEPMDAERTGRVLGRADLDWRAQADSLIAAGLARPLLDRLEEPAFARWAPALFGSMLRQAGILDEARELRQRAALERLAGTLREHDAQGIVVGGAGLWPWGHAGGAAGRAVGAIEVVVSDPVTAEKVRSGIESGGGPTPIALRSEIGSGPWGLPEEGVLRATRALPDPALDGLRRLAPSEALVCAMLGVSASGLRAGLEVGFDVWAALQDEAEPTRVASIVAQLKTPRAFWVPARVLADTIGVPMPAEILAGAPDDRRQRRLERIAARRLFRRGPGSAMAEWSFRWAWPALAADTASDVGRRLPSAAARAARDLPTAWRDIAADGVRGAVREARRVAGAWTTAAR
jgi:pyruvate-formate lyase-activating enzyme